MALLAFKATDAALQCKGVQLEQGVHFVHTGPVKLGQSGFHVCLRLKDVAKYYPFDKSRLFIAQCGLANFRYEEGRGATDRIMLLHEITADNCALLVESPEVGALMKHNLNDLFHFFAAKGCVAPMAWLLDHYDTIHVSADLLMDACKAGHLDLTQFLLDRGVDVHAHQDRAIQVAGQAGHLGVVQLLANRGANVNANEDFAFRIACELGFLDMVQFIYDHHSPDVHAKEDLALSSACRKGQVDVVQFLLKRGAHIHARDGAPLQAAARGGHLQLVQFLLDQGAHIHAADDAAVVAASENGHLAVVRFLAERGAHIHARDDAAVQLAVGHNQLPVVEFLVGRGAVVTDDALKQACRWGHDKVVKFLTDRAASMRGATAAPRTCVIL